MGMRTNTAVWMPNQNRWQIKVQKDGVRKTFTSAKPGRTGQREANRKADAWLDEGIGNTTKRCAEVWAEYLISVKATAGSSYADQVEKTGRNYILPVIGTRRIGDLNAGILQDVVYIKITPEVENGQIAAVRIDGEATLKRVYYSGDTLTLMPANPAYAPMIYTGSQLEDVHIEGKAVGWTHWVG